MATDSEMRQDARQGALVVSIVTAVAEAKGVDHRELDGRLFDAVDPDALARLFRRPNASGYVVLEIDGVQVRITDDYEVTGVDVPGDN